MPVNLFASVQGFARLSLISGEVLVRVADSSDWIPAEVNMPLYEGDSIWTPKGSRTEIQLGDGGVVRLDGTSSLNILKVDPDYLQLNLGMGRAYVRTGSNRQREIQMDLSESTVKLHDKGRYRFDIQPDGDEEISVFRGAAYVESYGSRTRVRTGEMLTLEESRPEISPVNLPDAWDRWNSERDAKRRAVAGEGRLPEELVIYEEELSSSGEWVSVPEYGYVWRPTLVVSAGWAPYREGRWIWRGGEYVWVSYEPWGWAPYHYGRWSVVAGFGWCWVPPLRGDVFWAPGYVGWITTPSYVGWVPLAPGEIYYGRGYYGRHSVNVTNVTNITNINVRNRGDFYRNVGQRNAVTSVDRNAFVTGRGRYSRHSGELLKNDRIIAGRPEPRPGSKAILMPRVRSVPADKLPPKAVVRVPVNELREKYPKVERGGNIRTPTGVEQGQPGRRGGEKTDAVRGKGTVRGGEGTAPVVKPQNGRRNVPQQQSPGKSSNDVKRSVTDQGEQPVTGRPEAAPVQPQQRLQDQPAAEQRSRGGRSEIPGFGRSGADVRVSPGGDSGRRGMSIPERTPRGVWKISPREDGPRERR